MYKQAVVLLLSLLALSAVRAEGDVDEKDVTVLTKANFQSFVDQHDLSLVEFYAPWCGHCKKLTPEYAKAATELKKQNIFLGKVDSTVEQDLAQRHGVKSYPTLKVFRKGNFVDYTGPRDTAGIIKYMEKQVGPSAKPIATQEELTALIAQKDVKVVGFFTDTSSKAYQAFVAAADALREQFRFAVVTDASLVAAADVQNGVVLYKDFDDLKVPFIGELSKDSLVNFVWDNSVPTAGEITKDNKERFTKRGLPILKFYIDVSYSTPANTKRTQYYLNRLKKLTENEKATGKLQFAIADKSAFKDEVEKLGLSGVKGEVAVGIDDFSQNLKYKFTEEFNVNNLQKFVSDYLAGKIKPYIKSEPAPDNSANDVTVVVGETFNDIVLDTTKDVLIEMYAPWCGHCKKLEPIYNELAKTLKDAGVNDIVIAKMDATANDSPHGKYQAKGYPTILFAPKGSKDAPIPYQGERDIKGFLNFFKQKATNFKGLPGKEDL